MSENAWWDRAAYKHEYAGPLDALETWASACLIDTAVKGENSVCRLDIDGDVSKDDFNRIVDIVKEMGARVVLDSDYSKTSEGTHYNSKDQVGAVWPDGFICISLKKSGWCEVRGSFLGKERPSFLLSKISQFFGKHGSKREVHALVKNRDGFDISSLGDHGLPLERGNYTSKVLEAYDHVVTDLQERSPCGRIIVIEGPPGTGKTHLIRGLLAETKKTTFVLLPPNMVEGLTGPNIIQALLDWREESTGAIVFVIEDADAVLSSRKFDNMGAVNELLNLGDGILGKALDIRIIATTNTGKDDIDNAIVRRGRLCRRIEVGELDDETALGVARRLGLFPPGEGVWNCPNTLADIYGMRGGDRGMNTKKKAGF